MGDLAPPLAAGEHMGKIHDVVIKPLVTHSDDRGYFREILRDDDNLLTRFGQTSFTKTYPGVIKAFHWHRHQDDLWYVAVGMMRVVLYDRRPDSPTHGETQAIYAGEDNPVLILVPCGVAHGYQVLGNTPAMLFYHTTQSYDADDTDEERIPFDDPEIGFDWSIKNR
jgi:dTDP-4-dehydrorhamnose 3,5-epimerase